MIFAGKLSTTKHPYQCLRSTISIQTLILPKKQKISRPNSKLALLGNERRADVPFQKYQDFLLVPHGRIHHSILHMNLFADLSSTHTCRLHITNPLTPCLGNRQCWQKKKPAKMGQQKVANIVSSPTFFLLYNLKKKTLY